MKVLYHVLLLAVLAALAGQCLGGGKADDVEDTRPVAEQVSEAVQKAYKQFETRLANMKEEFVALARQVMLQQFNSEERVRAGGQSGVRNIRNFVFGPQNYHTANHAGNRGVISIHAHTNHMRTAGLGELEVVINGVQFRTRHNDYKIVMPSTTSTKYHATEEIPFPDVPPSVLEKATVKEQIKEMEAYFRAFASQDPTVRDYKPYFKPVMCYMEGAWTLDKHLEEPFSSDRHHLDATSWHDLQDKIRYGAYTGLKSQGENHANLPTTIMYVNTETGQPTYAQWNYRILCNPIKEEIPFSYFKQQTDMKVLVSKGKSNAAIKTSNFGRFIVDDKEGNRPYKYNVLDRIFYDIVGKDNIASNLTMKLHKNNYFIVNTNQQEAIDTSRYTRSMESDGKDAMGNKFVMRGFNDLHMWSAQTTQPRVAPIITKKCKKVKVHRKYKEKCEYFQTRFSWAIPLEIIYLTPVQRWNPYNVTFSHKPNSSKNKNKNRGRTQATALLGSDPNRYYRAPAEFLSAESSDPEDPADTEVKGGLWVMCGDGVARKCRASGIKTKINVPGVGPTRLRWPIPSIYGEGSGVWKELNAVRDWAVNKAEEADLKTHVITFEMSPTDQAHNDTHTHTFKLTAYDIKQLHDNNNRSSRKITTSEEEGHTHELIIRYTAGRYYYFKCDGEKSCPDEHPNTVFADVDALSGLDFD